ncbi:aminodeoxychorismate lyase [Cellvibrio sp. NN19]|uniref:aminodeoxychorismate lyase n=1 Tax=Cellvibrio chitinivorans TaxID=3102792 RepID=UPI002B410467|nr:aminodeoxychorismate lyase [Cellvibrio sp. NN19]
MPINLPLINVNGEFNAAISPLDRGFAYGDGVFETCCYSHGSIPLWDAHCARLLHSAERLNIPVDIDLLKHYLNDVLVILTEENITQAVIKITLTRGVGGRGYRVIEQVQPTYCIGVFSGSSLQSDNYLNGVSVRICDLHLSQSPALAGMKHLNRLEHILARAEWHDEFAEGLLLDVQDKIIEATVSNVFAVKNNKLYTPDLSFSGVAGIMRKTIIDQLAPLVGVDCDVTDMGLAFLYAADEVFLCNSVYGIWPVNSIVDDRQAQIVEVQYSHHQITHKLQRQLERLLGNNTNPL